MGEMTTMGKKKERKKRQGSDGHTLERRTDLKVAGEKLEEMD